MNVLLAGASGQVGRRVLVLLRAAGHNVTAISGRDLTRRDQVIGLAEGCELVVSCAGASVSMSGKDKRGFGQVDPILNKHLLEESLRAGAKRFVYLSVHVDDGYAHTAYVKAHESFVEHLRKAPISSTVVRPTGIFSSFEDLLPMARKGILPLIGNGLARTNPIDPQDVAELIVKCLCAGPADLSCGGPEVLTRAQINEIVGRSIGKSKVWMPKAPAGLVRMQAKLVRLFHPRMADLMEFFSVVATQDCIAPIEGHRRMADYYASC